MPSDGSDIRGSPRRLRIASYNVHRCVGIDRRHSPARVADVLREIDADIVGVQELDARRGVEHGRDQWVLLAELAGYHSIPGPTLRRHDWEYGNGIFSRLPVRMHRLVDLSVPRREPRNAIDASFDWHGARVRTVVAHLGLARAERRVQGQRLLDHLADCDAAVSVLMGDFNEWLASSRALHRLHRLFGRGVAVASFPAVLPLLRLDRIWIRPATALVALWAHRSPAARRASDHLPVVAELLPLLSPRHASCCFRQAE